MIALVGHPELRLVPDFAEPERRPGEALVELRIAGICDTDLQLCKGYMGYTGVLGHEFVGQVVAADGADWVGARVVADINAGCGVCDRCTEGDSHHCAARTVLGILGRHGALAERFVVPERCLVRVPDAVTDESAVFAEPLAAALHVNDDLPEHCRRVVVLGDGKLGQLIARALVASGRETVVVGHHEDKLSLARAAGASGLLESAVGSELHGADAVVEATGSPSGLDLALRLVKPRGTVVLKTTVANPGALDPSRIVVDEIRVVGSRCGDMARAVDLLAARRVLPAPLIAARYPLRDAEAAVRHAARPGTLKVLVTAT